MVDFRIHLVTVNFCLYCNSERIIKIGQYLPKLCSDEKGPVFFLTHSAFPHITVFYRSSQTVFLPSSIWHFCQCLVDWLLTKSWSSCWSKSAYL